MFILRIYTEIMYMYICMCLYTIHDSRFDDGDTYKHTHLSRVYNMSGRREVLARCEVPPTRMYAKRMCMYIYVDMHYAPSYYIYIYIISTHIASSRHGGHDNKIYNDNDNDKQFGGKQEGSGVAVCYRAVWLWG